MLMLPPHWMPNSRMNVVRASTMRASIWICGVCSSSRLTRSMMRRRWARMSLTMSELVRLSTSIRPLGESSG
jgi:hypothetical protein